MARGEQAGGQPFKYLNVLQQAAGTGPVPTPDAGPEMSQPDSTNNVLFPGLSNSPQPGGGGGVDLGGQRPIANTTPMRQGLRFQTTKSPMRSTL